MKDSAKKLLTNRSFIQTLAAVFSNAYLIGFINGKLYTGNAKMICVPGLNCYSCPAAVGSCPIGAIQTVLATRQFSFSYYVFGIVIFFGVIFGRLICGFLCPFGLLQDLLYKIPGRKLNIPTKIDKPLKWLKYAMLVFLVILFPIFLVNEFGIADPFYCKWICPAGILEGGIPLLIQNESLRAGIDFLFSWRMAILIVVILASVLNYRPFCKYLCPLGAFYALFNKISFFQMNLDEHKCIGCNKCQEICKMGVPVRENINHSECIRCLDCKKVCPTGAIESGFKLPQKNKVKEGSIQT